MCANLCGECISLTQHRVHYKLSCSQMAMVVMMLMLSMLLLIPKRVEQWLQASQSKHTQTYTHFISIFSTCAFEMFSLISLCPFFFFFLVLLMQFVAYLCHVQSTLYSRPSGGIHFILITPATTTTNVET